MSLIQPPGWLIKSLQTSTVTVSGSAVNVTISEVDLSKAIPFSAQANLARADTTTPDWKGGITCRLATSTTLQCLSTGLFATGAALTIDVTVVEFVFAPKSVQEICLSGSPLTLSQEVDLDKSFILPLGGTGALHDIVTNAYASNYYLSDSTHVTNRAASNDNRYALVIEGF